MENLSAFWRHQWSFFYNLRWYIHSDPHTTNSETKYLISQKFTKCYPYFTLEPEEFNV